MGHIDWENYKGRLHRQGETLRERRINRLADSISKEADSNPACRHVTIDGIPRRLFLNRTDSHWKRAFNSLPHEAVPLGAVIEWEGSHWLVTESLMDDEVTVRGAIEQCNRQLVWQNPKTREIIRRWCTIAKPYYSNLRETTRMTTSSREFKIQLPYDYETSQIDLDKRFMLDIIGGEPKCYKCSSVDANTERYDIDGESVGFLVINVEQDEYNKDADNAELEICDYLPPFDIIHERKEGTLIIEADANGVVPGGLPLTLTARLFDTEGVEMQEDGSVIWTVIAPPDMEDYVTTDEEALAIRIKVDYYSKFAGKTLIVSAQAANNSGIRETYKVKVVNAV